MKHIRIVLSMILMFAATSAFAICGVCTAYNTCESAHVGIRCYFEFPDECSGGVCTEEPRPGCNGFAQMEAFDAEYRIVAVNVEVARTVESDISPLHHQPLPAEELTIRN